MARKLYYEDCHLTHFTARVTGCTPGEQGWEVTLDATAFYPEGGGQACDTGTLGGVAVTDVRERNGEVIHLCREPLEAGTEAEGIIDYPRRFDLMQQHTGEHIVSGIIHRRYGYHNTGFHIGAEVIQIDFDGVIPAQDLGTIEQEANEALWQNLPLRCWYPSREELPGVVYRTKRPLPWPVRIVQVPGFDSCACCGIHVSHTGEVGLIKLFTVMPLRGGSRIEMACGRRALALLSAVYDQNRQTAQAFSAKILETGEAARSMNRALAAEKFQAAALRRRLFRQTAQGYAERENVLHFEEGLESSHIRELADAIAAQIPGTAAVFSGSEGSGYGFALVSREQDLRPLGKALTQELHGRGGGKPNFQQGRVSTERSAIEAFFALWQS